MKSRQLKKAISSAFSLLLAIIMIFSISVPHVFAQSNMFAGTGDLEVGENETVDLLRGVAAASPTGENLQVTVKNVTCETNGNYQYDGSGVLNVGSGGSVYRIEYEAVSPTNAEERYSTTRKITVIPEAQIFEDGGGSFQEEVPDKAPEKPLEENSGILPEETQEEEILDDSQQEFTDGVLEEFIDGSTEEVIDPSMGVGTQILFENGIHYIIDPAYPEHKITLFCMNNELHWPHHTEDMGDVQVPGYTEGYLKPSDFQSQRDYDECMRRLSKLLYAGYPYNGERLYKIVDNSSNYAPTIEQFNEMLIVPAVLQTAYPFLGHHDFTYEDYTSQNVEHLEYLRKFTGEVIKLNINGTTTSNGLTFEDISSMPFYKAAFSITNCNNQTPLEAFQYFYGSSYFVTEEEAYNATQNAVWHLLHEYGIPNNNINSLSTPLATVLDVYSQRGGLLDYKPSADQIEIQGDLRFTYHPKDGMWHSSPLKIIEPEEYRGIYKLELPKGVTAQCDNLNYVYGNEEYELVSDHQPTLGETFGIRAEFVWLKEFKQYSPTPDIEFEGKKFQHMIGAVIENETLYISKAMESTNVGNIAITKKVIGETDSQTEFNFELKLVYHNNFNGLYGDLEFHNGVAQFTLKDGETKKAINLPAGAYYVVKEQSTLGYQIGETNTSGSVPVADDILVTFTNTKLPDLTLSKTVTGEMGDKTKQFEFVIKLKNKKGYPVTKTFNYIGSVSEGSGLEKPADGQIKFTNGEAKISLSHGQQITIKDLPYESTYTVTEKKDANNPYIVTYNGKTQPETGQLNTDVSVKVVNNKEYVPPTGITNHRDHSTGIGVAIALGGLCALFGFGLFRRRRGWKK